MFDSTRHDYATHEVADTGKEKIYILTAKVCEGKWIAGYIYYRGNGKQSSLMPKLSNGWFSSEDDAKLYYIGYFLEFKEYLSKEIIEQLLKKKGFLLQKPLFPDL